jgi:transposase
MAQALSMDLRSRVIKAIEGGLSCWAAAIQFGISAATAVRWRARHKQTGHFEAMARGGNMRAWNLDDHYGIVMEVFEANRDATLAEMCTDLAQRGIVTTKSSLDRLFVRHGFTRKKRLATR